MSVITNNLLLGDEGYFLTKSLRFRSSASAYLNRTPASAGNRKTWTYSTWIKRGAVGAEGTLISGGATTGRLAVFFDSTGRLISDVGGTGTFDQSTAVYRDPSAWYHFVWQFDTTQTTAANRSRMYINGVQISLTQTRTFALNTDYQINNSVLQTLGTFSNSIGTYNFDGYQAETYFIDGQALTPSSFGSTNAATGVWQPIKYTGTYGTNGFYLPFTDVATTSGSNAGLGKDFSGNGNYWTTNNISVTTGTTYDSMTDVPTLTNATTANYAVLNPLNANSGTISNGNLSQLYASASYQTAISTIGMTSGKWYCEITCTAIGGTGDGVIGIAALQPISTFTGNTATSYGWYSKGSKYNNGTGVSYNGGATWTTNSVIGVAFDADAGTLTFYKDGVSQGDAYTGIAAGTYFVAVSSYSSTAYACNFGQQPFAHTPPTGFVALNTFNLSTPTIGATASTQANDYFDATLYTGTGSAQSITNSGSMQPDLVWVKGRDAAKNHTLVDSVRGATKNLVSNSTNDEGTWSSITAFNSNGFTLGTDANENGNGNTFVAWQWKANGSGSTNTAGSITSTVSANTTAGFSIVSFTSTGSQGTVGHGLGVAPSMIIMKQRSSTSAWSVYHISIGNDKRLILNATDASATDSIWGNTTPTSTVFTQNVSASTPTVIAYCFAEVAGYSKFGSYTGNGSSDGPFIFTGFRPRFIMFKVTSTTNIWIIHDTARDTYNVSGSSLLPNASDAEYSNNQNMDILSNGFKLRSTDGATNQSGQTFIYAAFAEFPFRYSLAR